MKKLILAALMMFTVSAYAQTARKFTSSGYGALTTSYTRFNGEGAIVTGAYGGWLINHKFLIGLGGYGMLTSHDGYSMNNESKTENELKMFYGGLVLGYTIYQKDKLSITTNVLVGGGGVVNAYKLDHSDYHGDNWKSEEESGFKVIQPSIAVEYSVTNWFRVGAGGGYRYITGADMSGISNKDMSAPMVDLTLKFGVF